MAELLSIRGNMGSIDTGLSVPPVQALHDAWDTPAYALGKKFWDGDRCFKYAKATATMNMDLLAASNCYGISGYAVCPTAAPAGGNTVYATVGAAEGAAADGAVAKNELSGGYVTVFKQKAGASDTTSTYRILTNSAVAAGGGSCTLKVSQGVPYALTTSAATEINPNPYRYLTTANTGGNRWFVGLPMIAATTTYPYFWVQTWGPCWIAPQAAVGATANVNSVVARHDGSIDITSAITDAQIVGDVMTRVAGGAETQGTPGIFLRISC